jgi:hypothetical protein
MRADALGQYLTPFRQQQLGVAKATHAISGIEDDGGCDYGSEQRAASNFVNSSYQVGARDPSPFLELESTAQSLQ